jgi:hypothetical protein
MNRTIFGRLMWKEYRLQRSLWIAMAVLALVVMLPAFVFVHQKDERLQALYWIAMTVSAFYGLGCGASLFAGERENGTYEFQRLFPVTARQVFCGKTAFAFLSLAALFAATWAFAMVLNAGVLPKAELCGMMWTSLGVFGVELLLWAILFSLLTKRVLVAAVFGVAVPSCIMQSVVPFLVWSPERLQAALLPRLAIVACLAAVDFWLGWRWFLPQVHSDLARGARAAKKKGTTASDLNVAAKYLKPTWLGELGRLVWQHWRQSRGMFLLFSLLVVPIMLVFFEENTRHMIGYASVCLDPANIVMVLLASVVALLGLSLMGTCTFQADQRRNSFRFLADRGMAPSRIWWSRQVLTMFFSIAMPLVFIVLAIAAAILRAKLFSPMGGMPRFNELSRLLGDAPASQRFTILLQIVAYVLLAITVVPGAIGQFCSMFIRSSFLAGFVSVILTAIALAWCWLMWLWQLNWLWSVLPMVVALFVATYLHTADWLVERRGPRTWLRPGIALLLPMAAILVTIPLYRVYQIPVVDPGFPETAQDHPTTPEEEANLKLYEEACNAIKPHAKVEAPQPGVTLSNEEIDAHAKQIRLADIAWAKDNSKAIALAMEASEKTKVAPRTKSKTGGMHWMLCSILVASGTALEEEGKLDEALTRYMAALKIHQSLIQGDTWALHQDLFSMNISRLLIAWSVLPGQTPERIQTAIRQLEAMPSEVDYAGFYRDYRDFRTALSSYDPFCQSFLASSDAKIPIATIVWLHLPWERERAVRLIDQQAKDVVAFLDVMAENNREGKPLLDQQEWECFVKWYGGMFDEEPYALCHSVFVPPLNYRGISDLRWYANSLSYAETHRRVACLILAMEAWRLEHGSLPKKQEELVGAYLTQLPLDPFSGQPFWYFPDGYNVVCGGQTNIAKGQNLSPSAPFVWSYGEEVYRSFSGKLPSQEDFNGNLQRFGRDRSQRIETKAELLEHGWVFPIPAPVAKP